MRDGAVLHITNGSKSVLSKRQIQWYEPLRCLVLGSHGTSQGHVHVDDVPDGERNESYQRHKLSGDCSVFEHAQERGLHQTHILKGDGRNERCFQGILHWYCPLGRPDENRVKVRNKPLEALDLFALGLFC